MTINKKKRGYLSFILSLSIGITGCTKITTKNNVRRGKSQRSRGGKSFSLS